MNGFLQQIGISLHFQKLLAIMISGELFWKKPGQKFMELI
jgi:hypothetical protein